MRGSKKIKRIQLPAGGHDDITLVGIVSTDPHYKLALRLNRKLGISLKSAIPVEIRDPRGKVRVFTKFSGTISSHEASLHFFSNRSDADFLFKKLGNIDYLLAIYDPGHTYFSSELITELRGIDTVTAVFVIELNTLKDKNIKYILA